MQRFKSWLYELSAAIAASVELKDLPPCEVAFSSKHETVGIDLATGAITTGAAARCAVIGNESVFEDLVSGATTLQKAYLSGDVQLSGQPENLLRLALVFDACRRTIGVEDVSCCP